MQRGRKIPPADEACHDQGDKNPPRPNKATNWKGGRNGRDGRSRLGRGGFDRGCFSRVVELSHIESVGIRCTKGALR
jgi:hypothetical protein